MPPATEQKENPVSFANVNELFSSYEDDIIPMTFPARIAQAGVNMSTPPSELKWHPFLQNRNGNNPRFYDSKEEEFYQVFNFYYPDTYTSYMGGTMALYLNSYISTYSVDAPIDARTLDTAASPEDVLRSLDTPWVRNMVENNTSIIDKVPSEDGTYSGWQAESYFICSDGYPVQNGCITFRIAYGNINSTVPGYSTTVDAAVFNDVAYRKDKMPSVNASSDLVTVPVCDCIAKFPIIDEEGGGEEVNVYPSVFLWQQFEGDESLEYKHTHPIEDVEEEEVKDVAVDSSDYKNYIHDDCAKWTFGNHEFDVAFTPMYWIDEHGKKIYARAVTRIVAKYKGIVRPAIRAIWYDYLQRCLLYAMGHSTGSSADAEGTAWKEYVESQDGESSPISKTNQPYNRFEDLVFWYGDLTGPKMMGALGGGLVAASVPGADGAIAPVTPGERFTSSYNRIGAVGGASKAPEPCYDGLLEIRHVDDLDLPWYGGSNDETCKSPYYKTYANEYNQLSDLIEFIKENKYDENTQAAEFVMAGGAAYAYAYDEQPDDVEIQHEEPPAACGYYDFGINGCAEKEPREIMRLDEDLPTSLNAYTGSWADPTDSREGGSTVRYKIPVNCYQSEAGDQDSEYNETLKATIWTVMQTPMQTKVTPVLRDDTQYKDDEIRYSKLEISYKCYPTEAGSGNIVLPCGDTAEMDVDGQQNTPYRNRVYLTAEISGGELDRGPYTGYSYEYSFSTEYSYSVLYTSITEYTCEYVYSYSYSYEYSYSSTVTHVEYAFQCPFGPASELCLNTLAYSGIVELPSCWDDQICPVSQLAVDADGWLTASHEDQNNIHYFATHVCFLSQPTDIQYVGSRDTECIEYTCYTAYGTGIDYTSDVVTYTGGPIPYAYYCRRAARYGINACRSAWEPWVQKHKEFEDCWWGETPPGTHKDARLYGICPASLAVLDETSVMEPSPFLGETFYMDWTKSPSASYMFPGNHFDTDACRFGDITDTFLSATNQVLTCQTLVEYTYEYSYSYFSCYPLLYPYSYEYSYSYYSCYTYEYSYSYSYEYSYEYSYSYSVEYTAYNRNKMPRNIDIYLGIS